MAVLILSLALLTGTQLSPVFSYIKQCISTHGLPFHVLSSWPWSVLTLCGFPSQVRVAEYNNVRSQLNVINRKQAGRYVISKLWYIWGFGYGKFKNGINMDLYADY